MEMMEEQVILHHLEILEEVVVALVVEVAPLSLVVMHNPSGGFPAPNKHPAIPSGGNQNTWDNWWFNHTGLFGGGGGGGARSGVSRKRWVRWWW